MKKLILGLSMLFVTLGHGQTEFTITADGIYPKAITSEIGAYTTSQLYKKTIDWIEENSETHNLTIDCTAEDISIHISSLKNNAANLEKQYYNATYRVNIRFESGKYTFEPTQIQLKLNSKYDMGWEDFDLNNGSLYFKKGKPLRKYRAYLENIPKVLNELHTELDGHLKVKEN
ncbi:hypothetical protein [Flagellimonas meridianipacifica]|uniref:DUF4468 domain-containing protein n=1 Tax=Flagellimonas meridianipacifica TaxID=1080225 RepID=A0A2T0MFV4_9FLAO|nr:hypothetical protein [Allomuricauda pacifica]PRX56461.1 hypothetical protein CLV81_0458 [Allomuricauda pacifica]